MHIKQLPFVITDSITYALKGREILKENGIEAYIARTPREYDNSGCGYSIYIDGDFNKARHILTESQLKMKDIYDKIRGGNYDIPR